MSTHELIAVQNTDMELVASEAKRHLSGMILGPIALDFPGNGLVVWRIDRPNLPRVKFTAIESIGAMEVSAELEAPPAGGVRKPITRFKLMSFVRYIQAHNDFQKRVFDEYTTPVDLASLGRRGYRVIVPDSEQVKRFRSKAFVEDRGRIKWSLPIDKYLEDAGVLVHDAIYRPGALKIFLKLDALPDAPILAFHPRDGEDQARALYLVWNPNLQQWFGWPKKKVEDAYRELSANVLNHRSMHAFGQIIEVLRLVQDFPGIFVLDSDRLNQSYVSPFMRIACIHEQRAFDIEHFASVGMLAAATATEHLEGILRPMHPDNGDLARGVPPSALTDLNGFQLELLEHALARLVENTEATLQELKETLESVLWDAHGERRLHRKVSDLDSEKPEQCFAAYKAVGVSKDLVDQLRDALKVPTQLRHLWTHRGKAVDQQLFQKVGIGGSGGQVSLFGRSVRLVEGERVWLCHDDIRNYSWTLCSCVFDLSHALDEVTGQMSRGSGRPGEQTAGRRKPRPASKA